MVFSQIFEVKLFPGSIRVFMIFFSNPSHIKFTIESFPQRELRLFKLILISHIFIGIDFFSNEQFILILAILLEHDGLFWPILLLVDLAMSIIRKREQTET